MVWKYPIAPLTFALSLNEEFSGMISERMGNNNFAGSNVDRLVVMKNQIEEKGAW